jgi:hypothetical protein
MQTDVDCFVGHVLFLADVVFIFITKLAGKHNIMSDMCGKGVTAAVNYDLPIMLWIH